MPQTYQLTPTEVTTLLGQNNVWADCGPSTVEYREGNIAGTKILTQSGALITGQNVAYPRAEPAVSSITPITAPALLTGGVIISGNSGELTITVGKDIPNPYPLGSALFQNVNAGDVLVFDGIDGKITRNGVNAAASVVWVNFPQLVPGPNVIDCDDAVTVEYFPTYI